MYSNISDILKRRFTKELLADTSKDVYDLFQWKKVNVKLTDYKTGDTLVHMTDLEFPVHYSQNACDIIASKYFRKSGVPGSQGCENSLKQVVHRLVNFWMESLKDEGLIETEEQGKVFYDELVFALLSQMFAPNSPQWFNTGLNLSYGIKGSATGYYYDIASNKVVPTKDFYTRTQASACFILSIQDKLLGPHSISEQYVTETKLFKGGSGTGTNFSPIRAKGELLSSGGISSGLMSFLKGLDKNAGAIKSGGTTRRAAKMLCLDIDHPEILDYMTWKAKEEDKVRALGKMGYDMGFEGEAYDTVSGQNGNNSVRLSDEFMKKVENLNENSDSDLLLKGRVDSTVDKSVKVSYLWDTFNQSSWKCADPAPQFDDTFNAWHTCPHGSDGKYNAKHNRINSTNPCGEYAFLDDSACNLASINLIKFYDQNSDSFLIDDYKHLVALIQLALEASVHWGHFPTEDIALNTHMFRTTGLGISNLASLLMMMGLPYNSAEARSISSSLIGILTGHSYFVSSLMAKKLSPFEKYNINKKSMLRVIKNHCIVAGAQDESYLNLHYTPLKPDHDLLIGLNHSNLSTALKDCWNNAYKSGKVNGYRNAQVSVIAPTGTVSFAMDCGSTSIEPFFSHIVYKKLSGGGYMTIANPVIEPALKKLGYSDNEVKDIMNYITRVETVKEEGYEYEKIIDGKIEGAPHLKKEHLAIFDSANKCGSGERFIHYSGHVFMVAALTPLISGAISKTVNLPSTATIEDFKNVTLTSWKLGVKGISLYRDGSKASQPLNTQLTDGSERSLEELTYKELLQKVHDHQTSKFTMRDKPLGIRTGTTHPAQIDDVKVYTTVNRRPDGEICEIYITTDREGTIITGLLNSLSKSISVMLQHHVHPSDIAKMLRGQKYEPHGYVQKHPYIKFVSSISDLISKVIDIELDDYSRCQVKPETLDNYSAADSIATSAIDTSEQTGERIYTELCPNCSSNKLVKNGTCKVCLECGSTTGCS